MNTAIQINHTLIKKCQQAIRANDLKSAHQFALQLIADAPNAPEGYYYMAQVPLGANQYAKAIPILQKSLSLFTPQATHFATLTRLQVQASLMRCYGSTLQADAALELYEEIAKEIQSAPNSTENSPEPSCIDLDTIAVTLTRFEWHQLALPLFEQAIGANDLVNQSHQAKANLYCNLAASTNYLGDRQVAIKYYELALAEEPTNAKAHLALSRLTSSDSLSSSRIANLTSILSNLEQQNDFTVDYLFIANALFLELHKQSKFRQASEYLINSYSQANDVFARQDAPFNPKDFYQHIQSIRQVALALKTKASAQTPSKETSHSKMDAAVPNRVPNTVPKTVPQNVFIVGLPRSGSTLLTHLLTQNPSMLSLGERDDIEVLFTPFIQSIRGDNCSSKNEHLNSYSELLGKLANRYQTLTQARLKGVFAQTNQVSDGHDISHVIDKMHLNIWLTPIILEAIPDAKIIAIKKDQNDAIWSNFKYLFNPNDQRFRYSFDIKDIEAYYLMYQEQVEWLKTHYEKRVVEVEYETLIHQPQAELARLYKFVDVPHVNVTLSELSNKDKTAISTASSHQVRGGLTQKYQGQWQQYDFLFNKLNKNKPEWSS